VSKNVNASGKSYKCQIEGCLFTTKTSQGLGGHMSKVHPKKSKKYTATLRTREEREYKRQKMYEIKKCYFQEQGLDFEELSKTFEGKQEIQMFLRSKDFSYFKRQVQRKSTKI
jgi:hypothetical protein